MFLQLKKSRSLLMGLAILWVAFYHIPWLEKRSWLDFLHDVGYMGVDVFLLISGIGAVHSIGSRGGKGYLLQRVKRIIPGLVPVLLLWSGTMLALGFMNLREFFGSVTLTGWWFGQDKQLNWYFSAVWMYYLLAVVLYRPMVRGKYPGVVIGISLAVTLVLINITPCWHHPTAYARIPVFLLGMLLGRMELEGKEKQAKILVYGMLPVGLVVTVMTWASWGETLGYPLGLWWYPFALVVPGGVFLVSFLAEKLRKWKPCRFCMKPFEALGEASSEALMVQVGLYKLVQIYLYLYPKQWMLVLLICMVLGWGYHTLVVRRLPIQ